MKPFCFEWNKFNLIINSEPIIQKIKKTTSEVHRVLSDFLMHWILNVLFISLYIQYFQVVWYRSYRLCFEDNWKTCEWDLTGNITIPYYTIVDGLMVEQAHLPGDHMLGHYISKNQYCVIPVEIRKAVSSYVQQGVVTYILLAQAFPSGSHAAFSELVSFILSKCNMTIRYEI